jgi:hypothetical protein
MDAPATCEAAGGAVKKSFPGYYRPTQEEFAELWRNCLFVLDSNVLLNLYRYPKQAREDLLNILKKVQDRLWIPHQVAFEYQENRRSTIKDQGKRYDEVKTIVESTKRTLDSKMAQLKLKERHSLIDPTNFLSEVNKLFGDFLGRLAELEKEQPDLLDEDPIRTEIDALFDGRIGPPPESQEELDALYEEGENRYKQRRPPGYRDSEDKEALPAHLFNGLVLQRAYGDLILWKQTIAEAKKRSSTHLVFITDDQKEDWWWKEGSDTVGPRPELSEEIATEGGVHLFYLYTPERFMTYARRYLDLEVKQESIDQVRDVASLQGPAHRSRPFESKVEGLVRRWLERRNPAARIVTALFPDFIVVDTQTNLRHGYEVRVASHGMRRRFFELIARGASAIAREKSIDDLTIVLVATGDADRGFADALQRMVDLPPGVSIIVLGLETLSIEGGLSLKYKVGDSVRVTANDENLEQHGIIVAYLGSYSDMVGIVHRYLVLIPSSDEGPFEYDDNDLAPA